MVENTSKNEDKFIMEACLSKPAAVVDHYWHYYIKINSNSLRTRVYPSLQLFKFIIAFTVEKSVTIH